MNKSVCTLTVCSLFIGLSLSGCGSEFIGTDSSSLRQSLNTQSTNPSDTGNGMNTKSGTIVPINVLPDQLISTPAKYEGQMVFFGSVVTGFGAGYVMFGNIKVFADFIPGVAVSSNATITGICRGSINGFVEISESTIIPSCEVG